MDEEAVIIPDAEASRGGALGEDGETVSGISCKDDEQRIFNAWWRDVIEVLDEFVYVLFAITRLILAGLQSDLGGRNHHCFKANDSFLH